MRAGNRHGFTLVEIMTSVALVGIVIGISTSAWLALARASSIAKQCSGMHAELRFGFDTMTKDLFSASTVSGTNPDWFTIVANRSGVPTTVAYALSAGVFYQVESAKPRALVNDVSSFAYTMYEKDGVTATTVPADAYSIDVVIKTESTVASQTFDDIFQSRIMLRNKL